MVERHNEIVRQWRILRQIASSADCTVTRLEKDHRVCRRTIYRDLAALQAAGFPLYDERVDRKVYWRLSGTPFKGLTDTAFTFAELCAFYVNRSRFAGTGGSPVDEDFQAAMAKLTAALSPRMREYLDRLTSVLTWKPGPGRRGNTVARVKFQEPIVHATLEHRAIEMTYYSFASRKVQTYQVEPYRLTFVDAALYLYAYVPAYGQMRSFAVHRIETLKVLDRRFSPVQQLSDETYGNSMGPFTGTPQLVRIHFSAGAAPYIEECCWHPSQAIAKHSDGSVTLSMKVCIDPALRMWILGFGHHARVLDPSSLAEGMLEEFEEAREQYAPRFQFDTSSALFDERQFFLPFKGDRSESRLKTGSTARQVRQAGRARRATLVGTSRRTN